MHPCDEIRGITSNILQNKTIVLGVTGSIAAVECVKLAREFIRHGAQVIPVMTPAATKIIHPDALWFATGKKPIVELTGETEHVRYCGKTSSAADLLIIAPCTANTISKIAHGIDDTSVTTFATTALGSKIPLLIIPAMHQSMYEHNILQLNIKTLQKQNVFFIDPSLDGTQAKIASYQQIVYHCIRRIGSCKLKDKNILIIGGGTAEQIDDVRYLSNSSSGKTAVSFAKVGWLQGANIDFWYGTGSEPPPSAIKTKRFQSLKDIQSLIEKTDFLSYDIIIVCAAISDFIPERIKGKYSSKKSSLHISCTQAEKILPHIRKKAPRAVLIGFKLASSKKKAIEEGQHLMEKTGCNIIIANTIKQINNATHELWIIDSNKKSHQRKGEKDTVISSIYDYVIEVES